MDPVSIAVAFAAAAFSPFLQVLLDKAISYAQKKIGQSHVVKDELKRLQGTLLKIRAMLADVEMRPVAGWSLTIWLSELMDAAYDIDDVLDDFAMEVRRQQLVMGNQVTDISPDKVSPSRKLAAKIKETRRRLDRIAKERQDLQLGELDLASVRPGASPGRQNTSSFIDQTMVFGREEDKKNVIRMLLRSGDGSGPNNPDVAILPIVGMGGVGKTTLAQLVYNDEEVEKHFHLRMWVCVSHNFDLIRLTKEILESASGGATCDLTNLDMLQWVLRRKLAARRFLLVLDEVWDDDHSEWDALTAPLLCGVRGSRVLVTTRNRGVGRLAGTMDSYFLEVLSTDACWDLFKLCAFRRGNPVGYPKLETIGREIVKKLKGSPLAAKTLGRLLNSSLEEKVWRDILESEIWELQQDNNEILPVLRLSYQHLPGNLKQCFAFCCVFPKNFKFHKDSLIQIWMAEGFIQAHGRRRLEDIGGQYFDDLLCKSLLQGSKNDGYVMHDLIHDLAQSISAEEYFRTEDGVLARKMPRKVRHLSLTSTSDNHMSLFQNAFTFRSLRTLLVLHRYTPDISRSLNKLFETSTCIRVLDLRHSSIRELPDSICNLKHLRYIDVSNTRLTGLSESLGELYHLQTIKLHECHVLAELPKSTSNLTNLRHLEAGNRLISVIPHIGNLTNLQELREYKILKRTGHGIGELTGLTELRGSLSIRNLENVGNGREVVGILSSKVHLDEVELTWEHRKADTGAANLDLEVLQGLAPHANIKRLVIRCYGGHKSPSWMESNIISNLESMHLCNCRNWEILPTLGQLPFLRSLKIEEMYTVREVTPEFCGSGDIKGFPSLRTLHFSDMPRWERWAGPAEGKPFPLLSEFVIKDCPELKELPLLPPGLTKLHIENVGLDALPEVSGFEARQGGSLSLSSVSICDCHNLISLRDGLLEHQLIALERLTISGCEELRSLPLGWFGELSSLQSLTILDCPQLMPCAGCLPSSLNTLDIGSSHVLNDGLVVSLDGLASTDCCIANNCNNLSCCVLKVLRHMRTLDEFSISSSSSGGVRLLYLHSSKKIELEVSCASQLPQSDDSSLLTCLSKLSSISSLLIRGFWALTILPKNVLCHLTSLKKMTISSCEELMSLEIQCLPSLQHLTVEDCPKLTQLSSQGPSQPPLQTLEINNSVLFTSPLPNLTSLQRLIICNCGELDTLTIQQEEWLRSLSSLQKLWIFGCKRLRSIPEELQSLRLLESLKIQDCPSIESLPGNCLPDSLRELFILKCDKLRKQCNSRGPYWHHFSHIPYISIDNFVIQHTQ